MGHRFVICVLLAACAGCAQDLSFEVAREASRLPGRLAAVAGNFEYRLDGRQVRFRRSYGEADEPFRTMELTAPGRYIAATPERLYVWLGDSSVLEFVVGESGPAAPGNRLSSGDAAAREALELRPLADGVSAGTPGVSTLVVNPQRLIVANSAGTFPPGGMPESISVIAVDGSAKAVTIPIASGDGPYHVAVAPDNSRAYVSNLGAERGVSTIDLEKFVLADRYTPGQYNRLAVSPDGSVLYACDKSDLRAFDTKTKNVIGTFHSGMTTQDIAITGDGKTIFLQLSNGLTLDRLHAIDAATLTPRISYDFPANSKCAAMAPAPDEKRIYVSCGTYAKMYVFDASNLSLLASYSSAAATKMAFTPDGARLYVTYPSMDAIGVLNPVDGTRLKQISVGSVPVGIVIDQAGTRAYVVNQKSRDVTAIDLSSDSVILSFSVGIDPYFAALTIPAPSVSAAPTQLSFAGAPNQGSGPPQTVSLASSKAGLKWTATLATQSGGNWLSVSPASGTFPTSISVAANSTGLVAGSYSGTVTITAPDAANSPLVIAVALRVTASGTLAVSPAQLSFQGLANDATLASQTIQLTGTPGAVTWTAATTSPWIVLSATSGTTPSTLSVAANPKGLIAGRYEGTVNITSADAANSPQSFKVVMTLLPGPTVPTGGLVNAASFAAGAAVAPGSLASIFGSSFGPTTPLGADKIPLPTVLGEVKVLIGGTAAPLIFASDTQINCQVPFELAGQTTATLVVQRGNVASATVNLSLALSAPGIFTATLGTRTQGAILNANSSLNTPQNPARPGEIVQIFATGQGAVSNTPATGAAASSSALSVTAAMPTVLIGGKQANVVWSGLTPGLVGLWQVNAVVPADVTPGDSLSVQIVHGNALSNTTIMAVAAATP